MVSGLILVWSYPEPTLLGLGVVATLGAALCLVSLLRLRRSRRWGAGLTLGAGVSLVLLSWSPAAALASLILLVAGVVSWVRSYGARGPG